MDTVDLPRGGGSQAISTKLDPEQLARFELAVASSGLSRAAFIRAAVLREMVVLRPYEPLMAQGLATLAAFRAAVRSGRAVDDALVHRLELLVGELHLLAEIELR
ncbi:ribbon-helix-helix protein, CopG family [Sphingomonas sp. LB3N6]|uniref:ribbon-helix-helix protein, CopG family n=1 Tax=Sphingomonas fucosidasi TaxID=3096164 RepID=UPI002FC60E7A